MEKMKEEEKKTQTHIKLYGCVVCKVSDEKYGRYQFCMKFQLKGE